MKLNKKFNYKISFCITCMNRLHQLSVTLLKNLKDNEDYEQLEIILLDYNSSDGMEMWVQKTIKQYLASQKVIYFRTNEPQVWNPSHSRNLAFRLATGDIICNINADHFTGPSFARYVNDQFNFDENIVLTTIDYHNTKNNYRPAADVLGKVCVKKNDFNKIKGFDERMKEYGFEDFDLINRLENLSIKRCLIENNSYLNFLHHSNGERFTIPENQLSNIFIRYINASSSEIIILFKDNTYKKGYLVNNPAKNSSDPQHAFKKPKYKFQYTVKLPGWEIGTWENNNKTLIKLTKQRHRGTFVQILSLSSSHLVSSNLKLIYYRIKNKTIIKEIMEFIHFYNTRVIMEENIKNKVTIVNAEGFGRGTVYKNSEYSHPIVFS